MNKKFAIVLALALIAIVCCAGCIDPQEPVDPVDPVVPVDPVDPIAPVDPVEPTVEYTVMFMLNYDDAGAYTAETVTAGDAVSKPATPTRSGYTFNGWFTAAEGGAEYDFTLAVNADLTLYAQWNKKSSSSSGSSSGGHSHSYSWKVVTEPNCTAEGQGQYVCSCGQVKSNEAIPATGHLETVEEVNAETGVTEVKCKACGVVLVTIPAGSNNLEIKSVEELKAFADTVNAGTDYSGKTVKLVYDLDLEGEEWTPIGTPDNVFAGIFDGNGKTIRNLQIAGTENVGFFGVLYGTVQNLGLDGVTITGNHYLGAVAGYVKSGSVTGCTVTDAVITATPNAVSGGFDNGDKVGGIVGYGYNGDDGSFSVSGCTVTDSTLTAFRDVGGIVGAANGEDVTSNSVDGVKIIVDKVTNKYDNDAVNGNPILGRNLDTSDLGAGQTETDCTISVISDNKESIEDAAAAGADITLADNIEISGNLVMSGGSIDGNQKSIIHNDPSGYDCTITTSGGTIKNLKITGPTTDPSGRAIGPGSSGSYALTENLEISNVEIDYVTYAINGGASNSDLTVTVSDSKINGWISFSGLKEFKFVDCTLGKGNSNYGYIVIYGETVFDGCTFDEFIIGTNDAGFSGASGKSITLIDCYVVVDDQNVKVTADNFVQYLIDTTDSDYEDIIQLNFIVDGTDVSFT